MATNKRTEAQRLDDLPIIAELSIKGHSQQEIAEHLNALRPYQLTQQQISYDLQDVKKIWIESATQEILLEKGKSLATLSLLEREAWRAWESSQKPATIKTTQATVIGGSIKDGKMDGGSISSRQVMERTEERVGDKGYLDVIAQSIKQKRELLAQDSPKQTEQPDPPGSIRKSISIPAELIAANFIDPYRDIINRAHTEYVFYGGRGSTKSSFVSLAIIYLLVNTPGVHALAARQVGNTLRDSVYSQLKWAIEELGLSDDFKCITSPLEIEYKPTGQKIYFRGADDPGKFKSIKPAFGYIAILWLEELDQFKGAEAVRKIEQSVIRGGSEAYIFKSFNPPRTSNNWANKYVKIPKKNQYQHRSNYLTVPVEWLGQPFIDEANHLKTVNPGAYEHEYLGEVNGIGGQVLENVSLRKITDAEIRQFDRLMHGLDFGYYPDPAHYVRMHYDAARRRLFVFGEVRKWRASNRVMYDAMVKYGLRKNDLLICDSAEPKSVADLREYGANAKGAEKGAESVTYSFKWLQSLVEIVIDPERAPYTADECVNYEYAQDPNGDYISEFPDKDDHGLAAMRYGSNLEWRVRGK